MHAFRLTVFIPRFDNGGVERMLANLSGGLAERGVNVDILTRHTDGSYLSTLPPSVRLVRLQQGDEQMGLAEHLRTARPDLILVSKSEALAQAYAGRAAAGSDAVLVFRAATTESARLRARLWPARWWGLRRARSLYRLPDLIVANSAGVRVDAAALAGLPHDRVPVLRNPVVTPQLLEQGRGPADHPWLADATVPVVVGAGRLCRAKDFGTLIRAFARLRAARPARLVILGEGRQRQSLSRLAVQLGCAGDVDLPGFTPNPYPLMARAATFVLSSRWEGSPNVLVEALALGTPAVATDCPSGPREILQGGRVGELVRVGDARGLSAAITRTLDAPRSPEALQAAVAPYTVGDSVSAYLAVLEAAVAQRSQWRAASTA